MAPHDYKKTEKTLYRPTPQPAVVHVPRMLFLMVDGAGDPNTSEAYARAVEALYGLAYAIKMGSKRDAPPPGHFDYVVPPLEGIWWVEDPEYAAGGPIHDKGRFQWTMMIRQPEFVTEETLAAAKAALARKKPHLDTSGVRLQAFLEGLCVQAMHLGPFDAEEETLERMRAHALEAGYMEDMAGGRRHHEIYLSDPRKVPPEKWKTVLRHPIAPKEVP